MQLVGQRARRPRPTLLRRQLLMRRGDGNVVRMPLVIGGRIRRGRRQHHAGRVGRREIERGREIAADRAAPRGDVGLDQVRAARRKAPLDEPDERGVVERLRADPTTLAPRRNDDHRDPDAQTVGAAGIPGPAGEDLVADIHRREAFGRRARRRGRHQVIEEAVVLVVVDEQDGLAPELRVGRQRIQHL